VSSVSNLTPLLSGVRHIFGRPLGRGWETPSRRDPCGFVPHPRTSAVALRGGPPQGVDAWPIVKGANLAVVEARVEEAVRKAAVKAEAVVRKAAVAAVVVAAVREDRAVAKAAVAKAAVAAGRKAAVAAVVAVLVDPVVAGRVVGVRAVVAVVDGREVRAAARVVDKVVVAGRKAAEVVRAAVVRAAGAVVVGVVEVADRVAVAIASLQAELTQITAPCSRSESKALLHRRVTYAEAPSYSPLRGLY
jgi:hypothetical protein